MNFFDTKKIAIENKELETPFRKEFGICQDGTTPMYRDVDGNAVGGSALQPRFSRTDDASGTDIARMHHANAHSDIDVLTDGPFP